MRGKKVTSLIASAAFSTFMFAATPSSAQLQGLEDSIEDERNDMLIILGIGAGVVLGAVLLSKSFGDTETKYAQNESGHRFGLPKNMKLELDYADQGNRGSFNDLIPVIRFKVLF